MADIVVDGQLDIQAVRSHFPALKQKQVFLDNAGGSQILSDAIDSYVLPSTYKTHVGIKTLIAPLSCSIRIYLEDTNVQLGASYNVGRKATQKYNQGLQAAADFINADLSEIGTLVLDYRSSPAWLLTNYMK